MEKRDKQVEIFIKQAEEIAREWTINEIEGKNTDPIFADKMYFIHQLAKEVLNSTDDKDTD